MPGLNVKARQLAIGAGLVLLLQLAPRLQAAEFLAEEAGPGAAVLSREQQARADDSTDPVRGHPTPEVAPLEEIVVVASKEPRSIRDVAANVSVLSREDLDAGLAATLSDVFRYTPGIDVEQAGTRFGAESIAIRGIGGNRVAVLVDGVPLADQFDVGSFSNATRDFLSTGFVERIEVLHGPASALYGSAAIGGVVSTVTPDPALVAGASGMGGRLRSVWSGADDGRDHALLVASRSGRYGLLVGGSLHEGSEEESAAAAEALDYRDVERRAGLVKVVADLDNGATLRVGVIHQDAAVRSDLNSMLGSGRFRSTTALEGDDEYRMLMLNAAVDFGSPGGRIDSGRLQAYYQASRSAQATLDERAAARRPVSIDRFFRFEQAIRGVELNLYRAVTTGGLEHRLGLGLEHRERFTEEYRDGAELDLESGAVSSVILGEAFPLRDFPRSRSRESGVFVMDSVEAGELSVTAALRADRYELDPRPDAMYLEDYPFADPVAITASELSPKLGLTWRPADALDVYAQYTHGFRAPPYEDANIGLDIPFLNVRAVPNPDLRSESSDGVEIGLRWRARGLKLNAGWFRTDYDDFIASRVRIGTDPDSGRVLFQARNIERARISGFEAGLSWQVAGAFGEFAVDGSLYAADGDNRDSGQPLESVGPPQATVAVGWEAPDRRRSARLQLTATAAWDERDDSGGAAFEPPGYALLDIFLTQRIGERLTLAAALRNATDRTWWHWSAVRALAPGDPLLDYVAQPGRNAALSVRLDW